MKEFNIDLITSEDLVDYDILVQAFKSYLMNVLEYDEETKIATVEQRNKFSVGDTLEVFGPTTKVNSFEIESILNDKEEYVFSASHAQEIVKINIPYEVQKDDIIRVKIS